MCVPVKLSVTLLVKCVGAEGKLGKEENDYQWWMRLTSACMSINTISTFPPNSDCYNKKSCVCALFFATREKLSFLSRVTPGQMRRFCKLAPKPTLGAKIRRPWVSASPGLWQCGPRIPTRWICLGGAERDGRCALSALYSGDTVSKHSVLKF